MRIILDTDYEQNFVELWNPEKNYWERYIQCEKKETKPLNEEDKKIRKIKVDYSPDIEEEIFYEDGSKPRHYVLGDAGTELLINKINEIIDKINGGTND